MQLLKAMREQTLRPRSTCASRNEADPIHQSAWKDNSQKFGAFLML